MIKKVNVPRISVNILLLFIFTLFFYRSMLTSNVIQYMIVASAVFIAFFSKKKATVIFPKLSIVLCMSVFYFAFAIRHITSANVYQFIIYILAVMFFFLIEKRTDCFVDCSWIIIFFSAIYAICVCIQWKMPVEFNSYVIPLFNEWNQQYICEIFSEGYYMGFNNLVGDTAGYLVMGILVILAEYLSEKRISIWKIPILFLLLFALVLTGKRAHFLFLGITYILLIVIKNWNRGFGMKILKIASVFVIIFGGTLVCIHFFPELPIMRRIIETYNSMMLGETIDSGRMHLYKNAIQLFQDNYIFGIGWDVFPKLTVSQMGYRSSHDVNNCYLQLLCETGIVGTIIFLIPLMGTFFKTFQLLRKKKRAENMFSSRDTQMLLYCFGYQLFFWMYFFTESPMYDTVYLYMYFVTMAFVAALWKKIRQREDYQRDEAF